MANEDKKKTNRDITMFQRTVQSIGQAFHITQKTEDALTEVKCRTEAYYDVCEEYDHKPTLEGLALAIGVSYQTLRLWKDGLIVWVKQNGISQYLEEQYAFLQSYHITAMEEGTMDKYIGMFLARNNYGYKNEDQQTITHNININMSREELIAEANNLKLIQK